MDEFESHRPWLFSIAYRMLGSVMEAEDAVQETYLRYRAANRADIREPRAFLTTIITRLCLDQLKSARAKREEYYGPWLPEPLVTDDSGPAGHFSKLESLSMAFLVLLEQLTPTERAVFVLREVFDYSYAEIAEIVGRDEAACRQLLHRARQHIHAGRPRYEVSLDARRELLQRFLQAAEVGDMDQLEGMLRADVVTYSDGGGKVAAAPQPIYGREKVARFLKRLADLRQPGWTTELHEINGTPGILVRRPTGDVVSVLTFDADTDGIRAIHIVANPDKLAHLTQRS